MSRLWGLFERKKQLPTVTTSFGTNPLLPLGKSDDWDSLYVTWASVLHDGVRWRMYYSGKDWRGYLRVGLAFSDDGLNWAKHGANPVLDVGSRDAWDGLFVYCPIVMRRNDSWRMLFTGCDSLDSLHFQVGLAESEDGIRWTKFKDNPVFCVRHKWNLNSFQEPETEGWGLLIENDHYYLFYNPVCVNPRQIGVAVSDDLLSWKPLSSSPILPSEGRRYQMGYMKYCAWPFKVDETTCLLASASDAYYTKSKIGLWRLEGSLTSIKEVKFMGYILGTSAKWCERELDTPFIVSNPTKRKLLCYYGGRSRKNEWSEGLAFLNIREVLQK